MQMKNIMDIFKVPTIPRGLLRSHLVLPLGIDGLVIGYYPSQIYTKHRVLLLEIAIMRTNIKDDSIHGIQ